jgi:hypothetical protein
MTTYRVKHNKENPYVKLDKGFLQSPDLSAKAKGLLAYLLSLPSDWRICLSHLVKVFSDGEASIRSGLGELKKAGYLTKVAVRDCRGQIISWVTDVYETPHHFERYSDQNGNFMIVKSKNISDKDFSPDVDNPQVENSDLDNPHLDNHGQLINKDPLRNKLTNPPLPSQQEKEKEDVEKIQALESDCQFVGGEPLTSFTSLANKKDPVEENFSAASSSQYQNETKSKSISESEIEVTTLTTKAQSIIKRYDPALGIKEPRDWKTLQQKQFQWVPNGPWLRDKKLDASFIDWLATQWQKQYGGTIHQKRSDVLRHFKKDPANIAIAWEQYRGEHLHRYENAALRMHNGLEIKPDEQQQLLTHARAVVNPLPDELNPVANSVGIASLNSIPVFLVPASLKESVGEQVSLSKSAIAVEDAMPEKAPSPSVSATTTETHSLLDRPYSCSDKLSSNYSQSFEPESILTSDDGCVKNPSAYQQWKPTPLEDEPVSESDFSAKLAAFTKHLSMSAQEQESPKPTESLNELKELNRWLSDPILKREVLPRVMRSARYTVEFDELGNPYQVVEIKD